MSVRVLVTGIKFSPPDRRAVQSHPPTMGCGKENQVMNQNISVSPQAIMAAAVLDANTRGSKLEIEQISMLFLDLERIGIGVGDIALRKVPGGVYSDDAEAFVGRFLAAGVTHARVAY